MHEINYKAVNYNYRILYYICITTIMCLTAAESYSTGLLDLKEKIAPSLSFPVLCKDKTSLYELSSSIRVHHPRHYYHYHENDHQSLDHGDVDSVHGHLSRLLSSESDEKEAAALELGTRNKNSSLHNADVSSELQQFSIPSSLTTTKDFSSSNIPFPSRTNISTSISKLYWKTVFSNTKYMTINNTIDEGFKPLSFTRSYLDTSQWTNSLVTMKNNIKTLLKKSLKRTNIIKVDENLEEDATLPQNAKQMHHHLVLSPGKVQSSEFLFPLKKSVSVVNFHSAPQELEEKAKNPVLFRPPPSKLPMTLTTSTSTPKILSKHFYFYNPESKLFSRSYSRRRREEVNSKSFEEFRSPTPLLVPGPPQTLQFTNLKNNISKKSFKKSRLISSTLSPIIREFQSQSLRIMDGAGQGQRSLVDENVKQSPTQKEEKEAGVNKNRNLDFLSSSAPSKSKSSNVSVSAQHLQQSQSHESQLSSFESSSKFLLLNHLYDDGNDGDNSTTMDDNVTEFQSERSLEGVDEDTFRSQLISRFKLNHPVDSWKNAKGGFYTDEYLYTVNNHWLQFDPPEPGVHRILMGLYVIIMVIGCGGNLLVIVMFIKCRSLRTPPNYFVVNLAISDFLMLSKMPIFIYNSMYEGPALGDIGCKIYGFIGGVSGVTSIMTLAVISLDRYYVIVHPLSPMKRTTTTRAILMLIAVWSYSGFFSSLPLFGLNAYVSEGFLTSCSFDYLSHKISDRVFVFVFFISAWALPLSIISFSYYNIYKMVHSAERHEFFNPDNSTTQRESFRCKHDSKKQKTEVKIAVLSSVIIIIWSLAWTPYAIVALMGIFGFKEYLTPLGSAIPALFCKTASCIDPFLYAINHPRFQRELGNKCRLLNNNEGSSSSNSSNSSCCGLRKLNTRSSTPNDVYYCSNSNESTEANSLENTTTIVSSPHIQIVVKRKIHRDPINCLDEGRNNGERKSLSRWINRSDDSGCESSTSVRMLPTNFIEPCGSVRRISKNSPSSISNSSSPVKNKSKDGNEFDGMMKEKFPGKSILVFRPRRRNVGKSLSWNKSTQENVSSSKGNKCHQHRTKKYEVDDEKPSTSSLHFAPPSEIDDELRINVLPEFHGPEKEEKGNRDEREPPKKKVDVILNSNYVGNDYVCRSYQIVLNGKTLNAIKHTGSAANSYTTRSINNNNSKLETVIF